MKYIYIGKKLFCYLQLPLLWVSILLFVFSMCPYLSVGQPQVSESHKLLDTYISYLDELNSDLNIKTNILDEFFLQSINEQTPLKAEIISTYFSTVGQVPKATYEKLETVSGFLPISYRTSLESKVEDVWNAYIKINQFLISLNSQEHISNAVNDQYTLWFNIFSYWKTSIDSINILQDNVYKELIAVHKVSRNDREDRYISLENISLDLFLRERQFLIQQPYRLLIANKSVPIPKIYPQQLSSNISQLQWISQSIDSLASFKANIEKCKVAFWAYTKRLIEYKKKLSSTKNENEFWYLHNRLSFQLNDSLKYLQSQLVEAVVKKKSLILPFPSIAIPISLDIFQVLEKEELQISSTTEDPTSTKYVEPDLRVSIEGNSGNNQQKEFNLDTLFFTLNFLIDNINHSTEQNRSLQQSLKNYNLQANYYQGVDFNKIENQAQLALDEVSFQPLNRPYLTHAIRKLGLSNSEYEKLQGSIEAFTSIQSEMKSLLESLTIYLREKHYFDDQLTRSNDILTRFNFLFSEYDRQKSHTYDILNDIYLQYHSPNPYDPKIQSSERLLAVVTIGETVLKELKPLLLENSSAFSKETIINRCGRFRNQLTEAVNSLDAYRKMAKLSTDTTEIIFDRMIEYGKELSDKLDPEADNFVKVPILNQITFLYNEMVKEYNSYVSNSDEYMLRRLKEPYLFDVNPKPIQLVQKDTVVIKYDREDFSSLEGFASNNIVFLLDVSASMNNKLGVLKGAMLKLIPILRDEDQITIITYSSKARVIYPTKKSKGVEGMVKVVRQLSSEGGTSGNNGIEMAYAIAKKNFKEKGNNRIILATDGEFNVKGKSMRLAEQGAAQDIIMSVFDCSSRKESSLKLEELATRGEGTYLRINRDNVDSAILHEAKAIRFQ